MIFFDLKIYFPMDISNRMTYKFNWLTSINLSFSSSSSSFVRSTRERASENDDDDDGE